MSLTACAGGPKIFAAKGVDKVDTRPTLPAPPSFMRPVPIPEIVPSENPKVTALRNRNALELANKNLSSSRSWYRRVRRSFNSSVGKDRDEAKKRKRSFPWIGS